MELLRYLLLMFLNIRNVRPSGFYITNATYTWHEAIDNPPCHMIGMTRESIDALTPRNESRFVSNNQTLII